MTSRVYNNHLHLRSVHGDAKKVSITELGSLVWLVSLAISSTRRRKRQAFASHVRSRKSAMGLIQRLLRKSIGVLHRSAKTTSGALIRVLALLVMRHIHSACAMKAMMECCVRTVLAGTVETVRSTVLNAQSLH